MSTQRSPIVAPGTGVFQHQDEATPLECRCLQSSRTGISIGRDPSPPHLAAHTCACSHPPPPLGRNANMERPSATLCLVNIFLVFF